MAVFGMALHLNNKNKRVTRRGYQRFFDSV